MINLDDIKIGSLLLSNHSILELISINEKTGEYYTNGNTIWADKTKPIIVVKIEGLPIKLKKRIGFICLYPPTGKIVFCRTIVIKKILIK